jgi:hypothetical protein
MVRSATTQDSVSTRFGLIPLVDTPAESLVSLRHSRISMDAEMPLGSSKITSFVETDFFNAPLDRQPYRFRQYWADYKLGNWEVVGGQAWSLLRPNREGIAVERGMVNTHVPEPAYHPGLSGQRTRQVRLVRRMGAWNAAVSYEHGNQFLSKVTHDSGMLHAELVGLAGIHSERGLSAAAILHATRKIDFVAQLFGSRGAGAQAVGNLPGRVRTFSAIAGIEAKVTKNLELFAYSGNAHAGVSTGGQSRCRASSAGFIQRVWNHPGRGATSISGEFSHLTRSVWSGAHGHMDYVTLSFRYYLPTFR